ncbi:F-box protein [Nymphaea thermarum]|nr:F-box protein [Nymphaea thermarum]
MEEQNFVSVSSSSSTAASMSMISAIPNDVLANILSRLPVKPLLRFRRVCKGWRSLIDSDDFVEAHLSFAKLHQKPSFVTQWDENLYFCDANDPHFVVRMRELWQPLRGYFMCILAALSWFDGLCCVGIEAIDDFPERPRIYQIINPATRTSVKLPKSGLGDPQICQIVRDPVTRVYKLLLVDFVGESMYDKFRAEIFSIGVDDSWRKLNGAYGSDCSLNCRPFVNGAIHWIYKKTGRVVEGTPLTIVAFDVSQERFWTMRPPEDLNVQEDLDFVADFRGSLCLLHFDVPGLKMEFWVLQDYDNSVWVRQHIADCHFLHKGGHVNMVSTIYMGTVNDTEILFLMSLYEGMFNISYNPDRKTFETVEPRVANELEDPIFKLYIESLAGRNTTGHEINAGSGGGGDGDDDDDDDDEDYYHSSYDPGAGDGVDNVEFDFDRDDGNGGDGGSS